MNPYFAMNPNDIEEERQPNAFDVDDESDVYFLQQAYQYHETLVEDENRPVLTRNPIHRDREGAEDRLMDDYFDDHYAFDEYLQMSERTARDCLVYFNMCIIDLYMSTKPTLEDVEKIYNQHVTRHGFPGMLGSIDCMQWEWKNCPVSWQGQYGANNDINVLDNSPLFDDKAPVAPFVVNGVGYEKGYYLADGIYPQWATFVKSFMVGNDAKHSYFKKRQESARKDIERTFGVLQGR
ncbi:nucleotide-binding alpha-beta plait domain-containing protein [Tanacetum coccineum]